MSAAIEWTAERCAQLLAKAKRSPTGWKACCPAHEDSDPSLFLADGADGLALVCYAGCDYKAIAEALESRGAVLKHSRDRTQIPQEHFQLGAYHSHWDYRDATGRVIQRVCRWEQPGGRKDIRPLVRAEDGWKWAHHPTPRPLFQLDRLSNDPGLPVIMVEGEKAAVAAQKLFPSYIATTWPGGAQAVGQADREPLRGRDVVLVPDCDAPGRKAMEWWAQHLKDHARAVRIADPGHIVKDQVLPKGWDLADALTEKRDVSGWLDAAAVQDDPPPIVLRHVADIVEERRECEWISGLHKILERGVIAMLAGFRDTLKSFVALHWAMTAALSAESVVILSGEGGGLGRRIEAWMKEFAPARNLRDLKVLALERPVRLNAVEVMCHLVAAIDAAAMIPTLIVVDTLSKFTPGMKENATEEVAAFIHLLSTMLRDHYGCTVLLVAHAGHADAKRPRGSSVLMANPDAEYITEKPDPKAPNVIVTRDRFKDSPTLPPLGYAAKVVDLGRVDSYEEAVTSLVLWEASAGAVIASKPAVKGKARLAILGALRERSPDASTIWTVEELRTMGRVDLKLHKNSAREAVDFLTTSGHLIPAGAGGWKLGP